MNQPFNCHSIQEEGISTQEWIAQTQAHRSSYRRLAKKIVHFYPLDVGRVLDYGCGNGMLTSLLGDLWPRNVFLDGVDIDQELIAWANSRFASERLRFMPLENVMNVSAQYDLVVSSFVCHHWDDPKTYFMELLRLTKPGASIYVEDIDPHGFFSYFHASRLYRWLFHPAGSDFNGYRQSRQKAYSVERLKNLLAGSEHVDPTITRGMGRITVRLQKLP